MPDKFSEPYVPTVLEWRVMRFNSLLASAGQTFKHLRVEGSVLGDGGDRLNLAVICGGAYPATVESFEGLAERQQRAELSEIAKFYLARVRGFLDDPVRVALNLPTEIEDRHVNIRFQSTSTAGQRFAIWRNGEIFLPGEKGFD